jgi:pyrroline-5-carboxylate reductase
MPSKLTIGFLGAGKMATALAKGFIRADLVTAKQIIASDPSEAARAAFARDIGSKTTAFNSEVAQFAQVLLLAVKPDQVGNVLGELREEITGKHLVISIAAGVPLAKLEHALPAGARIIRVMPNTPALVVPPRQLLRSASLLLDRMPRLPRNFSPPLATLTN